MSTDSIVSMAYKWYRRALNYIPDHTRCSLYPVANIRRWKVSPEMLKPLVREGTKLLTSNVTKFHKK